MKSWYLPSCGKEARGSQGEVSADKNMRFLIFHHPCGLLNSLHIKLRIRKNTKIHNKKTQSFSFLIFYTFNLISFQVIAVFTLYMKVNIDMINRPGVTGAVLQSPL